MGLVTTLQYTQYHLYDISVEKVYFIIILLDLMFTDGPRF